MEWLMGPPGLIILLVILILIVGPKQLPKLGKQLGSTMKSVRTGLDEMNAEMKPQASSGGAGTEAAPVTCAQCATTAKPGTKFCPECGASLEEQQLVGGNSLICAQCGTAAKSGTKFCPECGAPL
ncbi:MAG: zinc ribbon domain-containing protein [Coriobacteriia bacterium]|nr:zinc ribbon domain-containing protein [Coriobacteriia bacterium]